MIRPARPRAGRRDRPVAARVRPLPSRDACSRPGDHDRPGHPGPNNAITDVAGVTVGHTTLIEGDGPLVVGAGPGPDRRHGHLPARRRADSREPVFAGCHRLNGNGELTGLEWVRESGLLDGAGRASPTPTASASCATRSWPLASTRRVGRRDLVAAGRRRDLRRRPQRHQRLPRPGRAPPRGARRGRGRPGRGGRRRRRDGDDLPRVQGRRSARPRASSRRARRRLHGRGPRPGQLRQARRGCGSTACGSARPSRRRGAEPLGPGRASGPTPPPGSGSIIVVVATDAPLLPHQCERLAQRAGLGHRPGRRHRWPHQRRPVHRLRHRQPPADPAGRRRRRRSATGRTTSRAVGDVVIDRLFEATIEATEEAIVNALVAATTMTGRDGITAHALPHDRLREVMAAHGR